MITTGESLVPRRRSRRSHFRIAIRVPLSFFACVKHPAAFTAVFLILLTGCVTTPPRDVLAKPAETIIATGFEPALRGVNVGTTVFQNRGWETSPVGFDPNGAAAIIVADALARPMKVIDGRAHGLALNQGDSFDAARTRQAELVLRLSELGRREKADRIVLLATGSAPDWIAGTNQPLGGLGLYRREFLGMKRLQVYGVFSLRVFDCQTQAFTATDTLTDAREVYAVTWHESWAEFSASEQRRLIAAWTELLKEQTLQLLGRAGLAPLVPIAEKSLGEALLLRGNRPKSWLPDGNVLPIPPGTSRGRARAAVVHGLKARGWTLVSEDDERVVGIYRDGAKEAGVVAVLTPTEIQLVADDHRIRSDGTRERVKPYARWQNNLKESIYRDLLKAEESESIRSE